MLKKSSQTIIPIPNSPSDGVFQLLILDVSFSDGKIRIKQAVERIEKTEQLRNDILLSKTITTRILEDDYQLDVSKYINTEPISSSD